MYAKSPDELGIADLPAHIWNTDETRLQDHFVSDKVVAEKGRPCYEINASEKGETSTVLATFNAVGQCIPPMIIFKGKRLEAEWCVGATTGTLVLTMGGSRLNSFLSGERCSSIICQKMTRALICYFLMDMEAMCLTSAFCN